MYIRLYICISAYIKCSCDVFKEDSVKTILVDIVESIVVILLAILIYLILIFITLS